MRIGESINAYDFFYKVLMYYTVCLFVLTWARQCMVQFHLTVNYSTNSYHRGTILWNAVHPSGLIDAIIMPEATLAAVTASVSHYY